MLIQHVEINRYFHYFRLLYLRLHHSGFLIGSNKMMLLPG